MIALWMAYSTFLALLAGATAALLEPFARLRRMPLRWLWLGTIVAILLVTIVVAVRPVPPPSQSSSEVAASTDAPVLLATSGSTQVISLDSFLLWSWGTVSALLIIGAGLALLSLSRLRRRSKTIDLDGTPIAITQTLGPGAAPFGSPRIFVPAWATTLEQRAVHLLVMHEREHLRAGDPRWLLAATAIWALMPWNLALWWCVRRLRCAMEIDCDARVLSIDQDVQSYGELLLLVASHRSHPRLTALLTFAESSSPLERRIKTMTERRRLTPIRALTLGAAAATAIIVACETPRPAPVAPTKTASTSEAPSAALSPSDHVTQERSRMMAELKASVPKSVWESSHDAPLMVVLSPVGEIIRAVRLKGVDEGTKMPMSMLGVEKEKIASVDIVKRESWLAPEVSAGLIYVKLKAEGDGDTKDVVIRERGEKFPILERKLSEKEAVVADEGPPLVEVRDANNRVVYSKRMASAGKMKERTQVVPDFPVDENDILKVDVSKPEGVIRIWLKPGAKLKSAK